MSLMESLYNRSFENGNTPDDAVDHEWLLEYPNLHEFLTCTRYNAKDRVPGKVQITSELGLFRVSIIDNAKKAMMSAEADTIGNAVAALEVKAGNPDAEWHRWGKARGARRRS